MDFLKLSQQHLIVYPVQGSKWSYHDIWAGNVMDNLSVCSDAAPCLILSAKFKNARILFWICWWNCTPSLNELLCKVGFGEIGYRLRLKQLCAQKRLTMHGFLIRLLLSFAVTEDWNISADFLTPMRKKYSLETVSKLFHNAPYDTSGFCIPSSIGYRYSLSESFQSTK